MIVCVCHRVSDRDIACAVREGCSSFEELQDELRVGTRCGACREYAHCTFELHASQHGACASARGAAKTMSIAAEQTETLYGRAA